MRVSVGLSDTPGLLVAVDDTELRSCVTLAEHDVPMTLELLRGTERRTVTVVAAVGAGG